MQLTELKIEGIRGFSHGEQATSLSFIQPDGSVPKWIVVAGRNGSGKSTFLQAIALAIAGPSVARLLAETFQDWIRDGDTLAFVSARLRFSADDIFGQQGRRPRFDPLVALRWERTEVGPEPELYAAPGKGWSPLRGPWAENARGWFTAGYGPFRRLSPASNDALRLMMQPGRPAALASLFREDASMSESVQWLQQLYLRRLEGSAEAARLEELVMRLLDDGLLPDGMRVRKVDSAGLWVTTPDSRELALKSLSDGYRTVAGLVLDLVKQLSTSFDVVRYEEKDGVVTILHEGVVLIDEIDVHLHVEWQKSIGFWMKEHFPNIQFVVTTHSPFVCQAADEGGLIRLSPAWAPGPAAEVVTGEVFNRVVNGTVDEAVLTDLFGLDSTLSVASRDARNRLAEIEAAALHRDLSALEVSTLADLRSKLPTSQADRADQALMVHRRSGNE
ncbi:AAA family ATPase [Nocardia alba]|uniref:AAA domain-containing protein n=1 Tax=Nocardia alba TaxID=225051 RepID=A0A4R1FVW7_9NOCA|nr:AAA family ATPase [Nocardia alba]TCJ99556.1 AAA domain-containing protein [Nocardia alba]